MDSITFSWDAAGLVVPVIVGIPQQNMQKLQRAGLPIPPSLEVRGLIDSASDICVISQNIVQHFALARAATVLTNTAVASQSVDLYEVSLLIVGPTRLAGPMLVRPNHEVMGATHPFIQQIEVLIGLDILRDCRLDSDGPSQVFTLSF
jgi:hypothetical protein